MIGLGAALPWVLAATAASAQVDPGSLERTRPDIAAEPAVTAPGKFTPPQLPSPAHGRFQDSFVLSAVVIDGATAFDSAQLAASFEPFLAGKVGQAELETIARNITEQYRKAGFVLSYAVVPEQSVQSGIVRIKVVEGFVGKVRLAGDVRTATSISKIFEGIDAERPVTVESLERAISLARSVPGVVNSDVQISRSPNDPANHVLTLVLRKNRYRAVTYADNRGTFRGARLRAYSSLAMTSLAVPGDQLQVDLFAIPSDKFRYAYGQAKGSVPLGADGMRLSISGSYGDYIEQSADPDRKGFSRQLAAELGYPFVKARRLSVAGHVQFADLKSNLKQSGTIIQRDQYQVARAWLEVSRAATVRIDGKVAVSQGLDLGSATERGNPLASRPAAGAKFTKFSAAVQVNAPLSARLRLRFDAIGQYSTKPLLAPEEFALGGSQVGRAFDFNEVTGDHGIGGLLELSYRPGGVPSLPRQLELYGFVDGGGAFRRRSTDGMGESNWLASAGAGARLPALGFLWSSELGVPLALSDGHRSVRMFFSTSRSF